VSSGIQFVVTKVMKVEEEEEEEGKKMQKDKKQMSRPVIGYLEGRATNVEKQ